MVKDYEMVLIVDSQLPEEDVEGTSKRYQDFLAQKDARIVDVDRWGVRKLAYEIGNHQQGSYAIFRFQAESTVISELDRTCRLDESVLRHLIVLSEQAAEPPPDEAAEAEAPLESEGEEEKTGGDGGEAGDADGENLEKADPVEGEV